MKKFFKITLIIFSILALASDALWCYIKFFAKNKSINVTIEGGKLESVEDENLQYIFNIRMFKNEDNSGVELFELKLNSFIDEEINNEINDGKIYETGIQFVNSTIQNVTYRTYNGMFTEKYNYESVALPYFLYNQYGGKSYLDGQFEKEQSSVKEAVNQCKDLYKDKYFLITIGDKIFKLKFKNCYEEYNKDHIFLFTNDYYRQHINFMYFCNSMYTKVKSMSPCENNAVLFKFDDYFDYQIFDESEKQYVDLKNTKLEEYSLLQTHLTNYYAIKVDIYDYGATQASESLFSSIKGQFNYNISSTKISDKYFTGNNIIDLEEGNFVYTYNDETGKFIVSLKSSAFEHYSTSEDYRNSEFDATINLTELKKYGINSLQFDKETLNFGKLKLHQIKLITTNERGEILTSEVVNVD